MASRTLPGLGLQGFWAYEEDGWHGDPGMDGNLRRLSALAQLSVIDKDLTVAPGSPSNGDIYIVGQGATGTWATQDGKIAVRDNGAWVYLDALTGLIAYVEDEGVYYRYDAGWALLLETISAPGNTKFQAFLNYRFVLPAADAWTTIPFNNAVHNDQGDFSAGSSYFTAPVTGDYMVNAAWVLSVEGASLPDWIGVGFGINGAAPANNAQHRTGPTSGGFASVNCTALLKLTAGDIVRVQAYAATNVCAVAADVNHFNGHMVP